jgi:putative nucleotidyltransferase with HDIG domain
MTAHDPAALLGRLRDLPALPQALASLLEALQREDVAIDDLAATLSQDQALAAKTLRLANSSFYGLRGRVNSIRDAIGVLGLRSLSTALTAAAVSGCFAQPRCRGFDLAAYWRHSIACGLCARHLARSLRLDDGTAFTAGLLHDLGRLTLASLAPDWLEPVYDQRRQLDCTMLQAERDVLGTDHAELGAHVARRWHFGNDVVEAIRLHHAPPAGATVSLTDLVHVADVFVHGLDLAGVPDEMVPPLAADAWGRVSLSEAECETVFEQTEAELEELCDALGV